MNKKILIVDDDLDIVEVIKMILLSHQYQVTHFEDTANLLERVRKEKPDLIILDVMFPENPSEGVEACRALKRDHELKKIPVVILSAINEKYQMAFSNKERDQDFLPCDNFLEKPIDDTLLLKTVKDLIES